MDEWHIPRSNLPDGEWKTISEIILHHGRRIEEALAYDDISMLSLLEMLEAGKVWLQASQHMVVALEIIRRPDLKQELYVWLAAGKLKGLDWCLEMLDSTARKHNCVSISFSGRRGWKRVLKKHGWREVTTFTKMRKELR